MIYYLCKAWAVDIIIGYASRQSYYVLPHEHERWRTYFNSTHPDMMKGTRRVPDLYLTLLGVTQYENSKTP